MIGKRYKLAKSVGAVVPDEHVFFSIPPGEMISINSNVDGNRIVEAEWNGKEVLLFADDIRNAAIAQGNGAGPSHIVGRISPKSADLLDWSSFHKQR